jgi:hypothetical protein
MVVRHGVLAFGRRRPGSLVSSAFSSYDIAGRPAMFGQWPLAQRLAAHNLPFDDYG